MASTLLIDGNNLIKRCIMASALEDLKAGRVFTGGVYGALNSFTKLIARPELDVGDVFMFFDCGVPARRKKLMPNYKADREKKKAQMKPADVERAMGQMHDARELFETLGVTCLAYRDREADDALAEASRYCVETGRTHYVVSGDHDLYQCVYWDGQVWDLNTSAWLNRGNFYAVTGLAESSYVFYRTLTGDTSDNLKGAIGVGEKNAKDFTHRFHVWLSAEYDGLDLDCGLASEGIMDPFDEVERYVATLEDPRAWELNIVRDRKRLSREYRGIDLSASFGPATHLRQAIDAGSGKPDFRAFFAACYRLAFKSALGDPDRFINPVKATRARADADRRARDTVATA